MWKPQLNLPRAHRHSLFRYRSSLPWLCLFLRPKTWFKGLFSDWDIHIQFLNLRSLHSIYQVKEAFSLIRNVTNKHHVHSRLWFLLVLNRASLPPSQNDQCLLWGIYEPIFALPFRSATRTLSHSADVQAILVLTVFHTVGDRGDLPPAWIWHGGIPHQLEFFGKYFSGLGNLITLTNFKAFRIRIKHFKVPKSHSTLKKIKNYSPH
jgi:hypothetical protein